MFKNHFTFITGVRVKFRFERLRKKLRSSAFDNCEIKRRRRRPLCRRAACILGTESSIRSRGAGKRKAGEKTQGLLWMTNSVLPKHKVPTRVQRPFTVVEDLSQSKIFFAEVFPITIRFVLAKKKIGG